jgi:hypothetical protein
VLAVAVIPRMEAAQRTLEERFGDYDSWVSHTDPDGAFTAKFPWTPQRGEAPSSANSFATVTTASQFVRYRYEIVEVKFASNPMIRALSHSQTLDRFHDDMGGEVLRRESVDQSSSIAVIDRGEEGIVSIYIRDASNRRFLLFEYRDHEVASHFEHFCKNFQPAH